VIDLLIASGLDEGAAREAVAQRLIVADIPLPRDREKTSSWPKHLREQGEFLRNVVPTKEATSEYEGVVTAIGAIAPHERVRWVLENEVWDRRKRTASIPGSAWIASAPSKLTLLDTEVPASSASLE